MNASEAYCSRLDDYLLASAPSARQQPTTTYGGTNAADDFDTLQYVRIEFGGIAFSPNNEINVLTLYGLNTGTTINHIQISYSGDDSHEWFGGTVNAKYLIAHRGYDDDFDTNNGFLGKVQFAVSLHGPLQADHLGSKATTMPTPLTTCPKPAACSRT